MIATYLDTNEAACDALRVRRGCRVMYRGDKRQFRPNVPASRRSIPDVQVGRDDLDKLDGLDPGFGKNI